MDHFRPYLLGDHFNIKTDHHSLEKLWKAEKGRLARWAVNLNEYDYTISYKPGKSNTNADALSRLPVDDAKEYPDPDHPTRALLNVNVSPDLKKLLIEAQMKCPVIMQIKQAIINKQNVPVTKDFITSNVPMQFYIAQDLVVRQLGNSRQVLVPRQAKTLQQYILKLAHDIPMSGHLGRTKTYQRKYKILLFLANYIQEYQSLCIWL